MTTLPKSSKKPLSNARQRLTQPLQKLKLSCFLFWACFALRCEAEFWYIEEFIEFSGGAVAEAIWLRNGVHDFDE